MTLKEELIIHKIWGGNELDYFNCIGKGPVFKQSIRAKIKKAKKVEIKRSEFLKL